MTTVIWIALAVGTAMVIQAQFMGVMTDRLGVLESVAITYGLGGGLAAIALLFARGGNLLSDWQTVPWYVFLSGIAGLVIVSGLGIAVTRIGIVGTMTLVIATQFVSGALIDQFGLFEAAVRPVSGSRIAGLVTVLIGTWLVLK